MILISNLNPLHFFSVAGVALADPNTFDLCSLAATFNTEDKNGAVNAIKKYTHKTVRNDEISIVIWVSDDLLLDQFSILVYDTDGNQIPGAAIIFAQVGATNYFVASIDQTDGDYTDYGKYCYVLIQDTGILIHGVTDYIQALPADTVVRQSVVLSYDNDDKIDYADAPSDAEFVIRVPATFVRPNYPEEIEEDKLPNGNSVLLSSSVKAQKLLKLNPVPGYLHHKMKVLLKCHNLEDKSKVYKQEVAYAIRWIEDNFEFGYGEVMLTEQDTTTRNIYKL